MEIMPPKTKFEDLLSFSDKLKQIYELCKEQNWTKNPELDIKSYNIMKNKLYENYKGLNINDLYLFNDKVNLENFLINSALFDKKIIQNDLMKLAEKRNLYNETFFCWLADDNGQVKYLIGKNKKIL